MSKTNPPKAQAAPTAVDTHLEALQKLSNWLEQSPMEEAEIETNGLRLRLKKPSQGVFHATTMMPSSAILPSGLPVSHQPPATETVPPFTSPMVGTFYRATSPDAAPLVNEGDVVKVGQTLCIIEAMKTMNQIAADKAGKIVKIVAQNAQPVEFGTPLFIIE